jgi:ABC-2 type transport system ATP-binding protein
VSATSLRARGLVRRFGATLAVNGVDLEVARGEIFGLLGPNGAGKTTTLRMICGLVKPQEGTVEVDGIDVWREPERAKARLGYLDEEPFLYPSLSGREFLNLTADLYGVPRGPERHREVDRLLKVFELHEKRDELMGGYSHGQRQKIGLASLLIHEPQVLLLDEPTNGMDPRAARQVKDMLEDLARLGRTVILSTHILEIAQALCDRVAIMQGGVVVAEGTMQQLRERTGASQASLEDLFLQLTAGPEARAIVDGLLR